MSDLKHVEVPLIEFETCRVLVWHDGNGKPATLIFRADYDTSTGDEIFSEILPEELSVLQKAYDKYLINYAAQN